MTSLLQTLSRQLLSPKSRFLMCQSNRGAKLRARRLEIGPNRFVAYQQVPGQRQPTIVFVPGLHSYLHMEGLTAKALLRFCDINDFPCIVYDHECVGESDSGDPMMSKDLIFSHWVDDVKMVVNELTEGPIVLVGASTGGWLALVAGQSMRLRLHGMLLYAPALNYVYPYYLKHLQKLPTDVRDRIEGGDHYLNQRHTFGNAILKRDFAEDSRQHEIDLENPIPIRCPVRIMHGLRDEEIHYEQSMTLVHALMSNDVDIIYRKNGPHQLDKPLDIEIFLNTLDRMLKDHPVDHPIRA